MGFNRAIHIGLFLGVFFFNSGCSPTQVCRTAGDAINGDPAAREEVGHQFNKWAETPEGREAIDQFVKKYLERKALEFTGWMIRPAAGLGSKCVDFLVPLIDGLWRSVIISAASPDPTLDCLDYEERIAQLSKMIATGFCSARCEPFTARSAAVIAAADLSEETITSTKGFKEAFDCALEKLPN